MKRLILADNQAIFRSGAARVLAVEDDMRIVAQCEDTVRMMAALEQFSTAILLVSTSMRANLGQILDRAQAAGNKVILVTENNEQVAEEFSSRIDGIVSRSISGTDLVDCFRRVGRGLRFVHHPNITTMSSTDSVGARVLDRLTPKEMQIVALIVQGCKNKDIALQLHTKEQVIKNYLRGIYDKTGVSDRLELALFILHHRALADAAAKAGEALHKKTA